MPTDYTSTRFPVDFIRSDAEQLQNGGIALAATAHRIAENQHWNAMGNLPLINFYSAACEYDSASDRGDLWTNETREVTVWLPPYCQHVAFYFKVTRNFDSTAMTISYVEIESSIEKRRIANITHGQDFDQTGKPLEAGALTTSGWIQFDGIVENGNDAAPGALQVATQSGAWQAITVSVTASPEVAIVTGAYRVLPNTIAYEVDV